MNEIRDFWDERGENSGLSDQSVTHNDIWQRWLEIEQIRRTISKYSLNRIVDIGCGSGYTTLRLADLAKEVLGVDFSPPMIDRARKSANHLSLSNVKFSVGDVMSVGPSNLGYFDGALSVRCLINLPDWDSQQNALLKIASILKPGGFYFFIEGSADGRRALNELRIKSGLNEMPKVWHNLDFEETRTLDFLSAQFTVKETIRFGVYDFISRVVHPLIVQPNEPQYSSPINEIGAELATRVQEFGNISRLLFLVLQKK